MAFHMNTVGAAYSSREGGACLYDIDASRDFGNAIADKDRMGQGPSTGGIVPQERMMHGMSNVSAQSNLMSHMPTSSMMGTMPNTMHNSMPMQGLNQFDWSSGGEQSRNLPEVDGRETLIFSSFVLVPPAPGMSRTTRDRPPGCRTVFIGGIPELSTDGMLCELMETCGEITSIRKKNNFAHIRFTCTEPVDKAIFYSGWRMKIGDINDKPSTGRIHVDYATARDDQYEYEQQLRERERELRMQQRQEDMERDPTAPVLSRYSDFEASSVTEMLKSVAGFHEGAKVILHWMDKGDVTSRTANRFYSMLNSVHSSVRRLILEKNQFETELQGYKQQYRMKVSGLVTQVEVIEKIFQKAHCQKSWDHFSKPQRKNIDQWTKQCQEVKEKQSDEMLADRQEDEMDLSDNDEPEKKRTKTHNEYEVNDLKDENDSLKCQLEGYKNELELNKQELLEADTRTSKTIMTLQETVKKMGEQILASRKEVISLENKLKAAVSREDCEAEGQSLSTAKMKIEAEPVEVVDITIDTEDEPTEKMKETPPTSAHRHEIVNDTELDSTTLALRADDKPIEHTISLTQKEGRILGIISMFLTIHPYGASVDYIWSYLSRGGIEVRASKIESLMEKFPCLFKQKLCGIGVNFERRWLFQGLNDIQ